MPDLREIRNFFSKLSFYGGGGEGGIGKMLYNIGEVVRVSVILRNKGGGVSINGIIDVI